MRRYLLVTAAVMALSAPVVGAQGVPAAVPPSGTPPSGRCIVEYEGSHAGQTTRATTIKLPSGKYNVFVGGGFIGHCHLQDVTLISDSAEYYGDQSLLYLIGNVHYIEPRIKMDSQRMTYWTAEGHLLAEDSVYAILASGTTMRGPIIDYYRVVPGIRTQAMMVATGRPHLNVIQRDSITGKVSDTVHVVADHITSVADSLTYAGGDVHITRPELIATGDSTFVDKGTGRARLLGRYPAVEARGTRPFTLTGGRIDIFSTQRQVDRIIATPHGHATSQDLQMFADTIDLRVQGNLLQRAIAWGAPPLTPSSPSVPSSPNAPKTQGAPSKIPNKAPKPLARAISPDRDIVADSIDAILPNQHIREMHAVRHAYATSIPDTATILTRERDWMQGDTIFALFDSVSVHDTSHTPPIRTLVASSAARAYYHVKNDKSKRKPGVNYVRGRLINVAFDKAAVQTVTVIDSASGVYLEPADSTNTQPTRSTNQKGAGRSKRSRTQ